MSKCFISLKGGLGNQLFQVATGFAYANQTNKDLYIDNTEWTAMQGNHPSNYQSTIFKNFQYNSNYPENYTTIIEKSLNYTPIPELFQDVKLVGYFQSLKYFEKYIIEFLNYLDLPTINQTYNNCIGFHIRRGDYLSIPNAINCCNTEYFNKCFDRYKDNVINVFTDSPEYVKNEFKIYNFNIVSTQSELHDLIHLSKHKNIVCSNSTFSWWASLIGDIKTEIIVPSKWMSDDSIIDIYREDFIKI